MSAVTIINKVMKSGVLIESLMFIPKQGATDTEIAQEEANLPRKLSEQHKEILRSWNGLNLEILRLYGCMETHPELRCLSKAQTKMFPDVENYIVFGDDPSGFMYAEDDMGYIYSVLVTTGEVKRLANNLNDFFERLVFGKDAKEFAGEDWEEELEEAGLLP